MEDAGTVIHKDELKMFTNFLILVTDLHVNPVSAHSSQEEHNR